MKPGPPPKGLKLLNDGRPSRQRRPLRTRPVLEVPEPRWSELLPGPDDAEVRAVAAQTWASMAKTLDDAGALSPHDLPLLCDYCVVVGRLVQIERRLSVEGLTLVGRDGGTIKHPLLATANAYRVAAKSAGDRLGVGVANRERMNLLPKPDEARNPFGPGWDLLD